MYCYCILTRWWVYDEISPESKGFPEGFKLIEDMSSYTPTQVTIMSFSITSTSQCSFLLGSIRTHTRKYWAGPGSLDFFLKNMFTQIFWISFLLLTTRVHWWTGVEMCIDARITWNQTGEGFQAQINYFAEEFNKSRLNKGTIFSLTANISKKQWWYSQLIARGKYSWGGNCCLLRAIYRMWPQCTATV